VVLPRGYVCDACNNGILAMLDNELRECPLFTFQWVEAVPYTKQGKLPEVRFHGAVLKKTSPRNVLLKAEPGSNAVTLVRQLPDGWAELAIHLEGGKKFDARLLARALCKIGLGLVA